MQCSAADAELFGGLGAVASAGFQGFHDRLLGEIGQVQLGIALGIASDCAFLEKFFGQIL